MASNLDFKHSDWYEVLGVPRTATREDIIASYKKLARKHHPDRNPNDSNASSRFALISKAHEILTDPEKKYIFDLGGSDSDVNERQVINIEDLDFLKKCMLKGLHKFGFDFETEISPRVLEEASQIAQKDSNHSNARVSFGKVEKSGRLEAQRGKFYHIIVDQKDLDTGFLIHCRSPNRDRFKLVLFDNQGNAYLSQESNKKDKITEAALFFLPFQTFSYKKPQDTLRNANSASKYSQPTLRSILSFYRKELDSLMPGKHLLCIYNDNFRGKGSFELSVYHYTSSELSDKLKSVEENLAAKKLEIGLFKTRPDASLQETEDIIKNHIMEAELLLSRRMKIYNKMLAFPSKIV
eukprot:TRINITY_DN22702_c0_g1_i1.p1 TRINITY_DN22702_c0_g1~~TRINITY_DN22702_c0_g1_i1.p1  ORF type:complete len:352 (+),score=27.61 TRINITY_DN22702_c0_g1_i1:93-1148(+)